jgi:hypothetical protein
VEDSKGEDWKLKGLGEVMEKSKEAFDRVARFGFFKISL